ncbi:DUF6801 domain-containing protein [Streptomyces sp. VRA16 Mangrove soil]|uniref:DUF6801 domain-containing protein n=1 Tax=Streptomyces sp. VRA16 Mangrove soil TaxID=2817434 RepID=UPI001A9F55BF|nr:DUF6801 domain-containing protein [Streptomyces sp. VRA16 Mangrove soil]MBO1333116.1 hypothetical protein [Streptomyces sp. VRA16 Mangrove soil]
MRGKRRPVLLGAAGLTMGLLVSPGSAASSAADGTGGTTRVDTAITYACKADDGKAGGPARDIGVGITARLPSAGVVGEPIQPEDVTVTPVLQRSDLAAWLPDGATTVAGTATVGVDVRQGEESATATWQGLSAQPMPLPAEGEVRPEFTGPVPSVTVGADGDVSLTATGLTLALTPDEVTPVTTTLTCEPAAGQNGRLGVVPVTGGAGGGTPGGDGTGPAQQGRGEQRDGITAEQPGTLADDEGPCPVPLPTGEMDYRYVPVPPTGDGITHTESNLPGTPGCAYAVGYANVTKLHGAMIINDPAKKPALLSVLAVKHTYTVKFPEVPATRRYTRIDSLGALDLPDSESTFLGFGFQPVTAKVSYDNGPVTISTGNAGTLPAPPFAIVYFKQSLRLHDVTLNGAPLDVGGDCRTAESFDVVLNGLFPEYGNVFSGGPLQGEVDIPRFSGCRTKSGENLDALFTASISGKGNLVLMNQGKTCIPTSKLNCPPDIPELPRAK